MPIFRCYVLLYESVPCREDFQVPVTLVASQHFRTVQEGALLHSRESIPNLPTKTTLTGLYVTLY